MAGAGYKLFNTGDVLLASEVNTYLMQQTVMKFANASARTTALSGVLAEGMLSYLADTNATEVYDGSSWVSVSGTGDITAVTTGANSGLAGGVTTGNADIKINFASKGQLAVGTGSGTTDFLNVGTNGHTLVADSGETLGVKWAAPTGAGLVLITSDTALTGSAVSFNNVFTSTYTNYRIIYKLVLSGNNEVRLRLRVGGTDATTNYNYQFDAGYQTTTQAAENTADSARIGLSVGDDKHWGFYDIHNPALAEETWFIGANATDYRSISNNAIYHTTATAYDGFTIYPSTGTFSSGRFYLYGYSK